MLVEYKVLNKIKEITKSKSPKMQKYGTKVTT
jgi:hypothetical protein